MRRKVASLDYEDQSGTKYTVVEWRDVIAFTISVEGRDEVLSALPQFTLLDGSTVNLHPVEVGNFIVTNTGVTIYPTASDPTNDGKGPRNANGEGDEEPSTLLAEVTRRSLFPQKH